MKGRPLYQKNGKPDHRYWALRAITQGLNEIAIGQRLTIPRLTFEDAFGTPEYMFDWRSPEDRLLEKLPGANFGAWRVYQMHESRDYIVSRHEIGKERVRMDWDRRCL
jgi:hypothetical protein